MEARRVAERGRGEVAVPRSVSSSAFRGRLAALLAVALLGTVAIGCGGDDSPSSDDVPSGAVATVDGVEISDQDLDEQVAALARAQRSVGGAQKGAVTPQVRKQLQAQALSMLLLRQALEQEAADRGIEVSNAEVRARWEAASQGQFKTKKALQRFLGGQTERDIIAQLRLQTLTERINQQVSEQAGGGKQGAKAVKQFQKDFQQSLQDDTACAEGYTAATGCGDQKK